ncbi:hypothetical protein BCR32DRAFT_287313 [Anaeromyces robustus]|uniref:Uncharacterized protein n=1 Tax=Anaeromyces robustus TaxID=1754192 RepID=A0A1Y1VTQ3_9FUNG|nr:hypothetical protein BCR32DRAFT_287313 [Anaeromyces robustus]|eukprot:ORX64114.1 hypothetical protein BCR32DRAFT_287313 [Anaeromyces robustus]
MIIKEYSKYKNFPLLPPDFMLIEKLCLRAITYPNFSSFGALVQNILNFKEFLNI